MHNNFAMFADLYELAIVKVTKGVRFDQTLPVTIPVGKEARKKMQDAGALFERAD